MHGTESLFEPYLICNLDSIQPTSFKELIPMRL